MKGVVAAGQRETGACTAEILRAGGNAVDAVIAGAAAAFVAEPLLASCGGGGMMAVALPGKATAVIDFFSNMPGLGLEQTAAGGLALDSLELDFEGVDVFFGETTQEFHVGRGAAAIPGALPGLAEAHRAYGSLPLADLMAPAERLARDGVRASPETAMVFALLWEILARDPATPRVFTADGHRPVAGDLLVNPALADTLAEFGRVGRTPERVLEGLAAELGSDRGGLITEADLSAYRPSIGDPLVVEIGDCEVLTSPAAGGQLVGVILRELVAGSPCERERDEVVRLALASRAGHTARVSAIAPGSTTHLSVIDRDRGAAAVTLSNGEGCGYVIAGTGIQVNNFLGEEDLSPHGFHQHRIGQRLPTMMAPSILLRRGEPALVLGSGGSNRIRTAVGQTLYRVLAGGMSPEEAVRSPRVHAEGKTVWLELEGLDDPGAVLEALREHFEDIQPFERRAFFFGGVHAAGIDDHGHGHGVGDTRRGGAAIVL